MKTTVIYITDNNLDERIDVLCKKNILESIGDLPLISVSQKPIDFGRNICVGKLPRSSLSINIQIMKALEIIETEYIAIAEHDCLYTNEHFSFTPSNKDVFYYNENVWVLQVYSKDFSQYNGMFSFFKHRKANSQVVCGTEIMKKAVADKIEMMSDPAWLRKYPSGRIGEAGAMDYNHAMRLAKGDSVTHIRKKLEIYITKYKSENWITKIPNIDIHHSNNLTKNRRGVHRRYELPYWGKIEDIFKL